MRVGLALLLALALAAPAWGSGTGAPADGTDPQLQAEMERLFALRQQDPQAFVAQARSLDSLPPPTNLAQREFLAFLRANRAAFSGRFADAIALAKPLAEDAEDPKLRLRAGAFVVNLMAGTREFEAGLRLLGELLQANTQLRPGLEAEQQTLWGVAGIFYNELGQPALAIDYTERVLTSRPLAPPLVECMARTYRELARQQRDDVAQTDADFRAARERCAASNATVSMHFLTLAEARFLRARGRLPEALALMEAQLGAIDSTAYPRLVAEAYALDAELLHAAGRADPAGRQARRAVELSKDLPTGLPAAMAERVLYDLARERGDTGAALRHLQNHVAASRALAEENRIKALAFRTVQHEAMQRELELQRLGERNRVLALEAEVAQAESRNAILGLGVLALSLAGLGAWAWRMLGQERRFREVAHSDALTGFANRQHFNARAEALLARAKREAAPVSLACFDLDHFKRINDQHGHLAGDAVLRSVSAAVQAVPVEAGITRLLGRIGGEEFAILLLGAPSEAALRHAEACRAAIAAARATLDSGVVLGVTASFGVTGTAAVGYALDTLFDTADRALYAAKRAGRDRIGTPAGQLEAA
jgi:diguanylate cyclase (GGDEF)-like protein